MNNIKRYNELWKTEKIVKPIVIIIGGSAGTGKSTIAKRLTKEIKYMNLVNTALIRSLLASITSKEEASFLHKHTFDLSEKDDQGLRSNFVKQSKPINRAVRKFIDFVRSEKQHNLIEGSNLLPLYLDLEKNRNIFLIEMYLKVENETLHRKMFSGPTHRRLGYEVRFKNTRILQEYVLSQAKKKNKTIFDFGLGEDAIVQYVNNKLGEFIEKL